MYGDFLELNEYVYQAARGAVLDAVIWCLGPFVDDSRVYGPGRLALAVLTRQALRPICRRSRDAAS